MYLQVMEIFAPYVNHRPNSPEDAKAVFYKLHLLFGLPDMMRQMI
jgi:hypothetical protein